MPRKRRYIVGRVATEPPPPPPPPTISPAAGTYATAQTVTITGVTGGIIRYTVDGSTPTAASPLYAGSFSVAVNTTVQAIQTVDGVTSAVAVASYTINTAVAPAAPAVNPASGTYSTARSVTMSAATGTTIRYTLNGSTPTTSSTVYTSALTVSATTTVKAIAVSNANGLSSTVTTRTYTISAATVGPRGSAYGPTRNTDTLTQDLSVSYPGPSGARYVSVTAGSNTTGTGTLANPWRTLGHAVTQAVSGDIIVLRAGVYHEQVQLTKPVTIQRYQREEVWLDGAVPIANNAWTADGAGRWYAPWTQAHETADPNGVESVGSCTRNTSPYPVLVTLDGVTLKQVDHWVPGTGRQNNDSLGPLAATERTHDQKVAAVTVGKFYVCAHLNRLYVGTNPLDAGGLARVSASNLRVALWVNAADVTLKGIGARRYCSFAGSTDTTASPTSLTKAAIHIVGGADRFTAETITAGINAASGMSFTGAGASNRLASPRLTDCVFAHNGGLGMSCYATANAVFRYCVWAYSNWMGFCRGWAAAGVKTARSVDPHHYDCLYEHNEATGAWFDVDCFRIRCGRSISRYNAKHGFFDEIDNQAAVASNYDLFVSNLAHDNKMTGMRNGSTPYFQAWHITSVRNEHNLIAYKDHRNICDPVESEIYNCISSDVHPDLPVDRMQDGYYNYGTTPPPTRSVRFDFNAYHRTSTSRPSNLIGWESDSGSPVNYTTLAAYRNDTSREPPREANGIELSGTSGTAAGDPFVNSAGLNFAVRSGSVLKGRAQKALTTQAAAALNLYRADGTTPYAAGQVYDAGYIDLCTVR